MDVFTVQHPPTGQCESPYSSTCVTVFTVLIWLLSHTERAADTNEGNIAFHSIHLASLRLRSSPQLR